MGQTPETPELSDALRTTYAGTLKHGAQLLAVWRSNLTSGRATHKRAKQEIPARNGRALGASRPRRDRGLRRRPDRV